MVHMFLGKSAHACFALLITTFTLSQGQGPQHNNLGFTGDGNYLGTRAFGLSWFAMEGNYDAARGQEADRNGVLRDFTTSTTPSFATPVGFRPVREIGKLEHRLDGLGTSTTDMEKRAQKFLVQAWLHHLKPWPTDPKRSFPWYRPDANAISVNERDIIHDAIARERTMAPFARSSRGPTAWEIGNEPNLFPSIEAKEYAAMFQNYYNVIKVDANGDPRALVGASIYLNEIMLPDVRALSDDLVDEQLEVVRQIIFAVEAGTMTATAAAAYFGVAPAVVVGIVALLGEFYVNHAFNKAARDLRNRLKDRIIPGELYFRNFLGALPNGIAPDFIGLHTYNLEYGSTRTPAQLTAAINQAVRNMQVAFVARYAPNEVARINAILTTNSNANISGLTITSTAGLTYRIPPVWITEFGNIMSSRTAAQVIAELEPVVTGFTNNPNIERWFFFKPQGVDPKTTRLFGQPAISRLFSDANFSMAGGAGGGADGFNCNALNEIGNRFWELTHGGSPCSGRVLAKPGISSFEPSKWQSPQVSLTPATHVRPTDGANALLVPGSGYRLLKANFTSAEIDGIKPKIGFDIFIPTAQSNPYWIGDAQLHINIPSLGVFQWVGYVGLTQFQRGNYSHVLFDLPQDLQNKLGQSYTDLEIQIALNGNGEFAIDKLDFYDATPPTFPSVNDNENALGFEAVSDWTCSACQSTLNSTTKTQGLTSLQVTGAAFTHIQGARFDLETIRPEDNHLALDFFVPQNPNPWWQGSMGASITCETMGINGSWMGQHEIINLQPGKFNVLNFTLPTQVHATPSPGVNHQCSVNFSLNSNETTLVYLLDNIRFSPVPLATGGTMPPPPDPAPPPPLDCTVPDSGAALATPGQQVQVDADSSLYFRICPEPGSTAPIYMEISSADGNTFTSILHTPSAPVTLDDWAFTYNSTLSSSQSLLFRLENPGLRSYHIYWEYLTDDDDDP